MWLTRISGPDAPAVDLARLQAHLKVEPGEDDAYLLHCLNTAISQFDGPDGELSLALVNQVWSERFAALPPAGGAVELSLAPVRQIVAAARYDQSGGWVDFPVEALELFEDGGRFAVACEDWGRPGRLRAPLRIDYLAGYGDASAVPLPICHAVLLFAAHLYEVREPVVFGAAPVEVPLSIARLVAPYKSWWR